MDTPTLTLSRRQLIGAAGGLTLGFVLPSLFRPGAAEAATPTAVNAWLTIGSDDGIALRIGSSDMGQGSFSGLGQVLAEDLMVDPERILLVQGGPTLANPAPVGSAINTVGSSVTRNNF
jgi:isoquinoline 1-oxidoreductase beta subunit